MSYTKQVVQFISSSLLQIQRKPDNKYESEPELQELVKYWMPSGSGIDAGTRLDFNKSKPNKLIFNFDYHHMDQNGFYCGWSYHSLIVTPDFDGFDMRIIGQHPSRRKWQTQHFHEYLYQTYYFALQREYKYDVDLTRKLRVYTCVEFPHMQVSIPAHWLITEPCEQQQS